MKISATQSMVAKVVFVVMSLGLALTCSAWSQTINPKDWFVLTPQSYWHYSGEGVPNGEIKNDNTMTVLEEKKDVGGGILATRMKMTTDNPTDNRNGDEQFWYVDPNDAEGKLVLYGLHNQKEDAFSSGTLLAQDIIINAPGILIGQNGQKIGDEVKRTGNTKVKVRTKVLGQDVETNANATVNSTIKYKEIISAFDTMVGKFVDVLIMNIDIRVTIDRNVYDVVVGDYWLKQGQGVIGTNYKDLAVTQATPKVIDSGRIGAAGNPYIQPDSNVLAHSMVALQTIADLKPEGAEKLMDVNKDNRVGGEESIYALQKAANLRMFGIMSSAFADGQSIPAKHSWTGGNISPELSWVNPPTDTKSYVLFVDDPDAGGIWNHWIVYDVPPAFYSLPENSGAENGVNLPAGAKHGITSWNRSFYEGPAPPSGVHRYYFKLYALNVPVLNPADASKAAIKAAMLGKVVGWTQVMGTYQAQ